LFMSPDPTVAHPYDTQDLNQYAYVGDNPMTYTDPAGLDSCDGQPSPCTPLPKLTVNGQGCITDANPTCQLIHLWEDATAGHRGYSGANNRLYNYDNYGGTQEQSKKDQQCTAAREAAAQLAKSLEQVSKLASDTAIASGIGAGISALGEVPSAGADTEATIGFGSVAGIAGVVSSATGALAAGLSSFAAGNLNALNTFSANQVAALAVRLMSSSIPVAKNFGESLGALAEQALGVVNSAQEACQ